MKTITKVIAKNMEVQLVEVQNTKQAEFKGQPPHVWTTYEIQVSGVTVVGGGLASLKEEYPRQCAFAAERAKGN